MDPSFVQDCSQSHSTSTPELDLKPCFKQLTGTAPRQQVLCNNGPEHGWVRRVLPVRQQSHKKGASLTILKLVCSPDASTTRQFGHKTLGEMSFLSSTALESFQTSALTLRSSGCHLSPAASAFSAILAAFIGSVINGLTSGWLVAFMTGWITLFAIFRVLLGGLYMFYRSITDSWGPGMGTNDLVDPPIPISAYHPQGDDGESSRDLVADESVYPSGWQTIPVPGDQGRAPMAPPITNRRQMAAYLLWPPAGIVRGVVQPPAVVAPPTSPDAAKKNPILIPPTDLDRNVTALGWVSLAYTVVFAPVTQVLFVAANASRGDIGAAKLVRGFTVAITALPLCIDCRVRYADALGWGRYAFNLLVSLSCLLQGAICATLLLTGLLDLGRESGDSMPPLPVLVIVYLVFALVWMAMSFAVLQMRDGGRKGAGSKHWAGYILDVAAGAFAGIFLAFPAIMLYASVHFESGSSGMSDLKAYLECETHVWRKFVAIAP